MRFNLHNKVARKEFQRNLLHCNPLCPWHSILIFNTCLTVCIGLNEMNIFHSVSFVL
jgi:hypothetical protein